MKTLLLFFSDENVGACPAVVPTLAHIARSQNIDFETYICTCPMSHGGKMLPFNGHQHMEQFLYLANFYDRILYCALTSEYGYQFRREVLAFGGEVICCRKANELADFYMDVFGYFKLPFPSRATIIPKDTESFQLAPYCYPDILYTDSVGIPEAEWDEKKYAELGVRTLSTLYCDVKCKELECNAVDTIQPDDSYGSISERIIKRWFGKAKGIGFSNPTGLLRWIGKFCRDNTICMYEPVEWRAFAPVVAGYAKKLGNDVIVGNQTVTPPTDDVATEFSKYNVFMNLIGVNPRIGFTLQSTHPLPIDWLKNAKAPWEDEYSDDYLREKIKEHAIPVCFLFYAADLGHLPTMSRFIDLMGIEGMRAGIAFPSVWYEYAPELLEQLYVPRKLGGVFPQLEPLISSGGISVITESKDFIKPELLTDLLLRARRQIAENVGEKMVPIGYYPFQDCDPYYGKYGNGEPQFQAVADAGFDYYITYVDEAKPARIVDQVGKMIIINEQTDKWFPWFPEMKENQSRGYLRNLEMKVAPDANEWLIMCYDSPFFGVSPTYMGWYEDLKDKGFEETRKLGMQSIMEAMQYVRCGGGDSKRLFMLKPHELARYARLLREEGLK